MKIVKTASGGKKVKISRKEWQSIGKSAGWMKKAQEGWQDRVDTNDPEWIADQLRRCVGNPASFWSGMSFQTGKEYRDANSKHALLKEMLLKLKNHSPTLEMLTRDEQKSIARQVLALKEEKAMEQDMEQDAIIAPGDSPAATMVPGQGGTEAKEEIDEPDFATNRQIEDIKNQLLDRYIAKEITEEQLKNSLTEFAKKHNLNIKLAKSNGRLQIRIAKKKTAQFNMEVEDARKEKALIDWEREEKEDNIMRDIAKEELVSNCCGVKNRSLGPDGPDYADIEVCPKCKENCKFVTE